MRESLVGDWRQRASGVTCRNQELRGPKERKKEREETPQRLCVFGYFVGMEEMRELIMGPSI